MRTWVIKHPIHKMIKIQHDIFISEKQTEHHKYFNYLIKYTRKFILIIFFYITRLFRFTIQVYRGGTLGLTNKFYHKYFFF